MKYSIKNLAKLAGVSVRTLHYYDRIDLLKPHSCDCRGYREYGQDELVRLQQILFFRELDFSLEEIKEILGKPDFNVIEALRMQRDLLQQKIARINRLIETVDKTILKMKGDLEMEDKEYYWGFSREQQAKYEQEIREKYGSTEIDESRRRMKSWSKEDFQRITGEMDQIFKSIRDNIARGYDSPEVQQQIAGLHKWLNNFYDCNLEMLSGLGHLYNEHPDFVKMYRTKYHEDMPGFLQKAIEFYCNTQKK
jgi:DNA-binding transcriptional MerR regulator